MLKRKRVLVPLALLLLVVVGVGGGLIYFRAPMTDAGAKAVLRSDFKLFKHYVAQSEHLLREVEVETKEWNAPDGMLAVAKRARARALLEQVFSYSVAFDTVAAREFALWRGSGKEAALGRALHFALGFAASLKQLELAYAFIAPTQGKPELERLLDEGDPEVGLPKGAFALLKWNAVHVEDVTRTLAAHQVHKLFRRGAYDAAGAPKVLAFVSNVIDVVYPKIQRILLKRGPTMFAGNGLDILVDGGYRAWFPVQAGVAEWMGDTKVKRPTGALISDEQAHAVLEQTEPGDVLVERRNWYLSNVGLPGFWPHAALYLGNAEELSAYLDDDAETTAHYGMPFCAALKERHPTAWAAYTSTDEHDDPPRVLEAMSEGVLFTTIEHSLHADYAASLRPRLSKLERAMAIERAFGYFHRPYDFDFDFRTDQSLVCSELVYKAYEPRPGAEGLKLPLEDMLGRKTLAPNTLVRLYDRTAEAEDRPFDFGWFLDGREGKESAILASKAMFRASHRRPKWDVVQP